VAIHSIASDSPAAEAQLQVNDIILRIDGQPVTSVEQIIRTVASHNAGDRLVLDFLRDGAPKQAVVVTKPPPEHWSRP
jgi:serine protease DegS